MHQSLCLSLVVFLPACPYRVVKEFSRFFCRSGVRYNIYRIRCIVRKRKTEEGTVRTHIGAGEVSIFSFQMIKSGKKTIELRLLDENASKSRKEIPSSLPTRSPKKPSQKRLRNCTSSKVLLNYTKRYLFCSAVTQKQISPQHALPIWSSIILSRSRQNTALWELNSAD